MTDPHAFLRSRRSVRRFDARPVDDAVIAQIIETAAYAPSAHNRQPWRFCVVTTVEQKNKLALAMNVSFEKDLRDDHVPEEEIRKRLARSRERIGQAPVVIVVCMDASTMDAYPDTRRRKAEYLMAVQSVSNAGLQLQLAAHAEGLGSVWVCSPLFAPEAVCAALDLPKAWEPQAMFFIGYPAETPEARKRKGIDQVAVFK
jgi:F420 biosynthesis protein FbiB-like protein